MTAQAVCTAIREEQEQKYTKFFISNRAELEREGSLPDKAVVEEHGGYIVAFRHQPDVENELSRISYALSRLGPLLPYTVDAIHTSCITWRVAPNPLYLYDALRSETLLTLSQAVQAAIRIKDEEADHHPKPRYEIEFTEVLANRTTVIRKGIPDDNCLSLTQNILTAAQTQSMDIKPSWGAHVTIGRFRETAPGADLVRLFAELRKTPSPRKSQIVAVDVGWFHLSYQGFILRVYERFRL